MEPLYQSYTVDEQLNLKVVAALGRGKDIVDRLKPKIDLSGTYKMAEVLPVSTRLYNPEFNNTPAIIVDVTRRNGNPTFRFIPATESGKADILEIARVLEIDLNKRQTQS